MNNQLPEEEKLKQADFVIRNDETQLVIPQVLALHEVFMAMAKTQ
jgi:dephospho-CoA kinase